MINLAGNPDCDFQIQRELERAGIGVMQHGVRRKHEVAATLTGKIGEYKIFTFTRAWTYWIAEGLVPMAVARELYDDPVGKTDVRVNGSCACPPPIEAQTTLIASDGRTVIDAAERDEFDRLFPESTRTELAKQYIFSDDPSAAGAQEFIKVYHIDTEVGLRLFADTIKKHGLAR